jgi:hypothetical protein
VFVGSFSRVEYSMNRRMENSNALLIKIENNYEELKTETLQFVTVLYNT